MRNTRLSEAKRERNRRKRKVKKKRLRKVFGDMEAKQRQKGKIIRNSLKKKWTKSMADTYTKLAIEGAESGFDKLFGKIRALNNKIRKRMQSKIRKKDKTPSESTDNKPSSDVEQPIQQQAERT